MPTKPPCYPTDFSPLMTFKEVQQKRHAAIVVAPNQMNKELPYTGLVAIDGEIVVHTDLDYVGVGLFVAEAVTRVSAKYPGAHLQSLIDIGSNAIGVVVPCPPVPPRQDELVAAFGKLSELTKKLFTPLLGQRDEIDGKIGG